MQVYSIDTGFFKLDGGAMFGVVPKAIWNRLHPADENNLCTWAMRCLLLVEDDRRILVDTGIGDKQDERFFSHYHLHGDDTLDSSLAKHGFTRDDITDVLLTHLHFDHVGGAVKREGDQLVPAFPNAVYWSNEAHWNWAVHPNNREKASFLKENILPLADSGKLQFIPLPQMTPADSRPAPLATASFTPNIQVRFANGHTRAMMLPQFRYRGNTVVYMADLLPSVHHIPLPYVMAYDMFPLETLREKESFLTEAAGNDYILFYEHDPLHACSRLVKTEKGIRAGETGTIEHLSAS
ncbi:MAG: MBL fold metallo-hydrolase [Flavihumibacter sp.]